MIFSVLKTCRNGKLALQMPPGNDNGGIFFILRAQLPKDHKVYPVHNWGDNFDLFDKGGRLK